jgi:CheY-like chemotaxis protein
MEHILFEELKLRNQTIFFNSGSSILAAVRSLFDLADANQVALIIIDFKMPGLNGIELINIVTKFLESKGVPTEDMPRFAFRAQQFWELSSDIIREIFDLGIKSEDIIEKVTKRVQI